jgi:hypothetical protein
MFQVRLARGHFAVAECIEPTSWSRSRAPSSASKRPVLELAANCRSSWPSSDCLSDVRRLMQHRVPFILAELGADHRPFMLHIYAAVAEKERRLIGDRAKTVLHAAEALGVGLRPARLLASGRPLRAPAPGRRGVMDAVIAELGERTQPSGMAGLVCIIAGRAGPFGRRALPPGALFCQSRTREDPGQGYCRAEK